MYSRLLLSSAFLTALSLAQTNNFNINTAQVTKVIGDVENYISTVEADPAFQTDVAALYSVIPSSVIAAAEESPEALLQQLQTNTALPAYISAIPTSVIDSLETLAAEVISAVDDVGTYLEQLVDSPEVSAALAVLETAVPTNVQNAFESDPVSFLENVFTATALPNWASDIPAPLQSEIGGVINEGLSIIAADMEGTGMPTAASSGFLPKATGTGSSGSSNTTKPSTGPVAPFRGAATPLRSVGAGLVALVAAAGFLIWL